MGKGRWVGGGEALALAVRDTNFSIQQESGRGLSQPQLVLPLSIFLEKLPRGPYFPRGAHYSGFHQVLSL